MKLLLLHWSCNAQKMLSHSLILQTRYVVDTCIESREKTKIAIQNSLTSVQNLLRKRIKTILWYGRLLRCWNWWNWWIVEINENAARLPPVKQDDHQDDDHHDHMPLPVPDTAGEDIHFPGSNRDRRRGRWRGHSDHKFKNGLNQCCLLFNWQTKQQILNDMLNWKPITHRWL